MNITEQSKTLFIAYAKDAGNWGGTPLVGGNVDPSKEARGNLTQLKKMNLITTFRSDGQIWLDFTPLGRLYAQELGIPGLPLYSPQAR